MTTAELCILSLVVQQPRHGYQIEQVIEQRGVRDWAEIGFSSIYYVLRRMQAKGWVRSRIDVAAAAGPARRVYLATPPGRRAWRKATLAALSEPRRAYVPLLAGLFNLAHLPAAARLAALRRYQAGLVQRRRLVKRNRVAARARGNMPWHADLMFDYSLAMTEAELNWIKRLVRSLAKRNTGGKYGSATQRHEPDDHAALRDRLHAAHL